MNVPARVSKFLFGMGGVLVLASIVCFLGSRSKSNSQRNMFWLTMVAIGTFLFVIAFVANRQARVVDAFLNKDDLIATWSWEKGSEGQSRAGTVHVGKQGFYFSGFAVIWSKKCRILDVSISDAHDDQPSSLVFHYRKLNYVKNSWHAKVHTFPIHVPKPHRADAECVVKRTRPAWAIASHKKRTNPLDPPDRTRCNLKNSSQPNSLEGNFLVAKGTSFF